MNDFFNISDKQPGDDYLTIHGSIIPSKGDVPFTLGKAKLHGPSGYQEYDVARFTIKTIDQNRVSVTVPNFLLPEGNLGWIKRTVFIGGSATCEGKPSKAVSRNTGKEHTNFLCSVTPHVGVPIGQDPRDAALIALNTRVNELETLIKQLSGQGASSPQPSPQQRLIVPTDDNGYPQQRNDDAGDPGVYVGGRRL